ncbi:hypothetical protein K439DRAFT_1662123 [Ramaria rubella]|nr:hypothetical protein K439DRAFT_1662123 [Ramaria rubella]
MIRSFGNNAQVISSLDSSVAPAQLQQSWNSGMLHLSASPCHLCRPRSESPFFNFPPEIVRLIIELAAAMCPHMTLTLTLVSKEVRAWVEPVLYHTVILWTPRTVELFRVVFAAKPPSFFTTHVKNLFINDGSGTDIIQACSRVERLAAYPLVLVGLPDSDVEENDPVSCDPGPESLMTYAGCPTPLEVMLMGSLEDVPWASPLFGNVLYLYLGLEPPPPEIACDISLLPSLTHCAFPYDGDEEDALLLTISTLLQSTTLTHLFILVNDVEGNPDRDRKGSIWFKLACITDKRLLVGIEPAFDGDDWKEMVDDGIDVWQSWEKECKDWRGGLI